MKAMTLTVATCAFSAWFLGCSNPAGRDEYVQNPEDAKETIIRTNKDIFVESEEGISGRSSPYANLPGQWYKGDLHCHTTYSDGDAGVGTVIKIAEDQGLQFLAITDHNTSRHWDDGQFHSDRLTLLFGVEWTTGNGHANIISNARFDWNAIEPTLHAKLPEYGANGDAMSAIHLAHSMNGQNRTLLFSLNHPNASSLEWRYSIDHSGSADCMEVWNAHYMFPDLNFKTVDKTYFEYAAKGIRLAMVGGSDSHFHGNTILALYNTIGMPTTYVYAQAKTGDGIIAGLKKGITFISSESNGLKTRLSATVDSRTYFMGETIPGHYSGKRVNFRAEIENAKSVFKFFPYSLAVVVKNGKPFRFTLSKATDYSFSFSDTPAAGDTYFVKVIQLPSNFSVFLLAQLIQLGWIKAITSPIFN